MVHKCETEAQTENKAINHYSWQICFWSAKSMSRLHAATLNNAMLKVNRTRFDYIRRVRPNTRGRSQATPTHCGVEDKTDVRRKSQTRRSHRPFLNRAVFNASTKFKSVWVFFSHQFKSDYINNRISTKSESAKRRQGQENWVCTMTVSPKTNSGPTHISCQIW